MSTVLVVDDKEMMRDSVGGTLQRAGLAVVTAEGGEAALAAIAAKRPDVVVSDMKMPGLSGLELLERIRQIESKTMAKLRHPSRSQSLRDYLE